jgi:hypothetical protein
MGGVVSEPVFKKKTDFVEARPSREIQIAKERFRIVPCSQFGSGDLIK